MEANTDLNNQPLFHASLFDIETEYEVRRIEPKETHWFLLNIHYAKRLPSISYAYGLVRNGELVGVITYGKPPSKTLCEGVCGVEYSPIVLELNRLCLRDNKPNEASRLVGKSLALLPRPSVVVSFADSAQDHTGYIYQATNFLYTGLSTKRNEWAVKGMEHLHSKTLSGMFRGELDGKRPIERIKEMYGDDFYYRERSRKHRYIMILGNKTEKKQLVKALRYPLLPYPKKENTDGI